MRKPPVKRWTEVTLGIFLGAGDAAVKGKTRMSLPALAHRRWPVWVQWLPLEVHSSAISPCEPAGPGAWLSVRPRQPCWDGMSLLRFGSKGQGLVTCLCSPGPCLARSDEAGRHIVGCLWRGPVVRS